MTSFVANCIRAVNRYHPKIRTGLILGRHQLRKTLLTKISGGFPIRWAKKTGADYLVLDYKLASGRLLKAVSENGLEIIVWTVNEKNGIERFLSSDLVYGVITNYPDVAVELRNQQE